MKEKFFIFLAIAILLHGCTSVDDDSSVNSQIPWGRPAKWESERVFTPKDLSSPNALGQGQKSNRHTNYMRKPFDINSPTISPTVSFDWGSEEGAHLAPGLRETNPIDELWR